MAEAIKFILNDEMREVCGVPTTMTLLQFLREQARLTGTKEGCAEGDCGACTAIVGTLSENGKHVEYKALNACIAFLPTLHGKQVITVEHLKSLSGGNMHPVQQAMVDCHGAQCGFCTPGFVMSLAALVHETKNPSDEQIQDSIAGNLCRCTGYRPILDAARQAGKKQTALQSDAKTLSEIKPSKTFAYQGPNGKFYAPTTTQELADVLAQYKEATMLAGGTDVGLWVTKQHRELETVVYTGNIASLHEIKETKAGLEIGAAATYTEAFEALAAYDPSMETLLRRLGSVQIRNAGTVGGNIANGSPIGDGMPPLIALGAKLQLRSAEGMRTIALEDFFIQYGKQDLKDGEFVERVIVPVKDKATLFKTYKISKRFDQDISAVCAAIALHLNDNGTVKTARIAYGGMAGTPARAKKAEAAIQGKAWNEKTAKAAMKAMEKDYTPLSDMRASADYRMEVAKNLLYRCWLDTSGEAVETEVYAYGS